jgi:hypothetical protein
LAARLFEAGLQLGGIAGFDQLELIALVRHGLIIGLTALTLPSRARESANSQLTALRNQHCIMPRGGRAMAEVVHVFEDPVMLDGTPYTAQVAGRPDGHMWEGWIEFSALDGSDVRRSPRETTQPDRHALTYWATGLSGTYLEGAFRRAVEPHARRVIRPLPPSMYEAPAPNPAADIFANDRAVLDPFSVGAKGTELLRRELGALRGWHLRNIVRAYKLADERAPLESMSEPELVDLIIHAVEST